MLPFVSKWIKTNSAISSVAILLLPFVLSGQNNVTFEAQSDARQVLLNNYFEVSFILKNANGTAFTPPDFKGFQILSGPNSSTSMQIVNGNVSREMGYTYTLQPTAVGKFTIGSASIKANGQQLTSQPLPIEVLAGGKAGQGGGGKSEGDIFVQLEPSKKETYVGEQISLDFKLYTTVSIDGYDILEEPDYKGFYAQEMRRFNSSTQREVLGGKQYTTKVLRRIALFPQQAGQLTISPAKFQLAVLEEGDRTGFFFSRNIHPVFYTTKPVTIQVNTLPGDAPENFSGAVGKYEFQASVNRNLITTDDAVSVMMLITGTGDVKRVQPPPLLLSDSFEIYAPKIVEEQMTENQGLITGKKVVEYLVLPKFAGEYTISPAFTYFDPGTSQYSTLVAGEFPIKVRQGTDKHAGNQEIRQPKPQNNDIQFIKLHSELVKAGRSFVASPVFWILTTLPIAAFLGLFFYKRNIDSHEVADVSLRKRKLANKEAQKRLETAKHYMETQNSRAFYDEVSKALLGYVCDKINIPLSQLSKENVKAKLQALSVAEPLTEDFMKTMQACEMALFAGLDNSADMQNTYSKAVAAIAGIEEGLGR